MTFLGRTILKVLPQPAPGNPEHPHFSLTDLGRSPAIPAAAGPRKPRQKKFMPQKSMKKNNGLSVTELTAVITSDQWTDLERFADNRLRRRTRNPQLQRVLGILTGLAVVHHAVEQFALGDLDRPGGRQLAPSQRSGPEKFVEALFGAINSIVDHALSRKEYGQEHVALATVASAVPDPHEPPDQHSLPEQLEFRDLERILFTRLAAQGQDSVQYRLAIEALRGDCQAGHAHGGRGLPVDQAVKNQARRHARRIWHELTMD